MPRAQVRFPQSSSPRQLQISLLMASNLGLSLFWTRHVLRWPAVAWTDETASQHLPQKQRIGPDTSSRVLR